MTIALALILLTAGAVIVSAFGYRKYGTVLNPLTVNTALETGVATILSGIFATQLLSVGSFTESDLISTAGVSGVYLAGTLIPYLFGGGVPASIFGSLAALAKLDSPFIARRFELSKFVALLGAAAVMMAALAIIGGGGTLWLTNPREAYLFHRMGAGPFWLLFGWLLITAELYYLWAKRPRAWHLIVLVAAFVVATYFTGSKANILTVLVLALLYRNFCVTRVTTRAILAVGALCGAGFVGLLFLQGAFSDLAHVVTYFENYQISAQFLARFDEFGYQWGRGWLSSFWFYVPRALVPAKPLEYGPGLIQKTLFPGAYEQGYAPGFLPWSLDYLDFGIVGVFIGGWWKGLVQRAAYDHFLTHRDRIFAFILMIQVSLWFVFSFASLGTAIAWCIVTGLFFRLQLAAPSGRFAPLPESAHNL